MSTNHQPPTRSPQPLQDRVALITGAGSGIGRAIALRFAAAGAAVAVVDVNPASADETVALVTAAGGDAPRRADGERLSSGAALGRHARAAAFQADVSVGADVERAVAAAAESLGHLDVLVNNAAVGGGDDPLATDEATWDRVLAVVLKGVFLCSRAVLPHLLRQRRGAIVNISSVNGLTGLGEEAYSAAKAGVINFTQNLAVRYGPQGIRANVICPGTIRTPIWRERLAQEPRIFERLVPWYPLGRVGEPEDVAAAALFLASDDASFITGAVLTADGGLTAGSFRMARDLLG